MKARTILPLIGALCALLGAAAPASAEPEQSAMYAAQHKKEHPPRSPQRPYKPRSPSGTTATASSTSAASAYAGAELEAVLGVGPITAAGGSAAGGSAAGGTSSLSATFGAPEVGVQVEGDSSYYEAATYPVGTAYAGPASKCLLTYGGQGEKIGISISRVPGWCKHVTMADNLMHWASQLAGMCTKVGHCPPHTIATVDNLAKRAAWHMDQASRRLGVMTSYRGADDLLVEIDEVQP